MSRSSSRRRKPRPDPAVAEARIRSVTTPTRPAPPPEGPLPIPPPPYTVTGDGPAPRAHGPAHPATASPMPAAGVPPAPAGGGGAPVVPPPPDGAEVAYLAGDGWREPEEGEEERPAPAPEGAYGEAGWDDDDAFIAFGDVDAGQEAPAADGGAPPGGTLRAFGGTAPEDGDAPGPLARLRGLVTGDELDPGRPGLRMLIVVGVVAVLAAVFFWWRARPHEEPLPAPAVSSGTRPASGSPAAVSAPPSASPTATVVVVDVAGKVRHPGVVKLPAGSRVVDAIRAAGGIKSGTHTGILNLARVVVDGEQILVGVKSSGTPPASAPPAGVATGASPGASTGGPAVSLNKATAQQLDTLPGVGPVLSQRIMDYRTQHGGFRSMEELQDVKGIGPKTFADLKPRVTL